MTYVPTWAGFIILAIVLDVWSRRVVGWAVGEQMTTDLVTHRVEHGRSRSASPMGSFTTATRDRNTRASPSVSAAGSSACVRRWEAVGDAYDNAMAESFFASLEGELLGRWARCPRTVAWRERAIAAGGVVQS
jgi:putative transposase